MKSTPFCCLEWSYGCLPVDHGKYWDKNTKDNNGWKPLHSAAWNGHMPVCQLIMENIEDKIPKDKNGWTPLHYAASASNSHMAICQLIMENVED